MRREIELLRSDMKAILCRIEHALGGRSDMKAILSRVEHALGRTWIDGGVLTDLGKARLGQP